MRISLPAILFFSVMITVAHHQVFSQTDTSKVKDKVSGLKSRDRVVLDLTVDNWFHHEQGLKTKWYSRGVNLYFMYDVKLGKSPVSIAPGIGVGSNNIFYNVKYMVLTDTLTEMREFEYYDSEDEYRKNKIAVSYLDIPIELRFRSEPNKKGNSFKVGLGIKGGLLINSHTKRKYEDPNGNVKILKNKRIDDIAKFRYGATFRIGYSSFNFLAYYSLSQFFEKDKGPEITPFSIGISINGL